MSAALRHLLLLSSLASIACRTDPLAKKGAVEVHVEARVERNPKNALSALVHVNARGATHAWVEHGDTTAYGDRTPTLPVVPQQPLSIPILGLAPAATSHVRVHAHGPGGDAATGDLTVTTDALPPGVPAAISVQASGKPVTGYVLAGLYDSSTEAAVAAMIDRTGRLRWYWVMPKPTRPAAHFDRVRGRFLVLDGPGEAFHELDLASEVRATWRGGPGRGAIDGHDFVALPNGNAVVIGWERHVVDTRSTLPGGAWGALRDDHTVDEIDPNGETRFHWSSFAGIGVDEIVPPKHFDPAAFQSSHANSVEVLPDGDLLVSLRSTSSIVKLSRKTGAIVWRWGGKKSDFRFIDDPLGGFSRQHDVRRLKNGDLMLFDNGNQHEPPVSRVVCYRLDEANHTATMTWEYRHEPDVFSVVAGSARRLPNGNTLVGWSPGLITEVDANKKVVWEARTTPLELYRALFTPSLYPDEPS